MISKRQFTWKIFHEIKNPIKCPWKRIESFIQCIEKNKRFSTSTVLVFCRLVCVYRWSVRAADYSSIVSRIWSQKRLWQRHFWVYYPFKPNSLHSETFYSSSWKYSPDNSSRVFYCILLLLSVNATASCCLSILITLRNRSAARVIWTRKGLFS